MPKKLYSILVTVRIDSISIS